MAVAVAVALAVAVVVVVVVVAVAVAVAVAVVVVVVGGSRARRSSMRRKLRRRGEDGRKRTSVVTGAKTNDDTPHAAHQAPALGSWHALPV